MVYRSLFFFLLLGRQWRCQENVCYLMLEVIRRSGLAEYLPSINHLSVLTLVVPFDHGFIPKLAHRNNRQTMNHVEFGSGW